jgi:diguanylate cyclase (GGDEF)-like protein/PAS domain S-box-containing protein
MLMQTVTLLGLDAVLLVGVGIGLSWFMGRKMSRYTQELEVAHKALIRHDADMASTQRIAKIGSWQWNVRTDVILPSPELCRIFDRCDFPKLAKQCDVMFPPQAWVDMTRAMAETVQTGVGYNLDIPAINAKGHRIWVNTRSEVIRDAKGEVIGMHGMVQDITERKQAEGVAKSERFIRTITNALPSLIAYWDKNLHCHFANDAYLDNFETSLDVILRINLMDLIGTAMFKQNEVHIRAVLAGEKQHFERIRTKADGSIGYSLVNYIPDINVHGEVIGFFTLINDFTALKKAEDDLRLADNVLQNIVEAVMVTDIYGTILSVNPAFQNITGYTAQDAIGKTPRLLKSDRHEQQFYESVFQEIASTGHWAGEIWNCHKNGEPYLIWKTITKIPGLVGEAGRYVSVFHDITKNWSKNESLKRMAFHDTLTDLPNRSLLMDRIQQHIALAKRSPRSLAVLFLDLDRFKFVNDNHGHKVGDNVLISVAKKLKTLVRESDTVARLGGDEFVILLDNPESIADVEHICNRVIDTINAPMVFRGEITQVGTSIGVAMYPGDADSANELINCADKAMYKAKNSGKNAFCFFEIDATNICQPENIEEWA